MVQNRANCVSLYWVHVGAAYHGLNVLQIYDHRWTWFGWSEIWSTLVQHTDTAANFKIWMIVFHICTDVYFFLSQKKSECKHATVGIFVLNITPLVKMCTI